MPLVNQRRYSPRTPSFYAKIEVNCPKSALVTNLDHYLASHLSEPKLSAFQLARMLCLSRASLHRKLVAYTGMNTTEYIRYFRIKQAIILLENEPDLNVFEIAMAVGFNSQSYFTKIFKEFLGYCPSQYRNIKCTLRHV